MTALWIVIIVVAVLAFIVIGMYNGLIKLKNRVEEAWSDIDVQLKRRYDLIPNLVSTVKGYAKHEEGTLTKVTEARTKALCLPENSSFQKTLFESLCLRHAKIGSFGLNCS